MKKKLTAAILISAELFLLCGCGSMFNKEYLAVSDYIPPVIEEPEEEKITVKNFEGLKKAILKLVAEGSEDGLIIFDSNYIGNQQDDMVNAVWEIRSKDALCAYYVENISYALNETEPPYEASVHISYVGYGRETGEVIQLKYSTGIEDHIKTAFSEGKTRIAVLINRSSYTPEEMENLVVRIYRKYPGLAPQEPKISVNMFSGNGVQRLYEINFNYGMGEVELSLKQQQLRDLDPFGDRDIDLMTEDSKALLACKYLKDNCWLSSDSQHNNVYSALIKGIADSEGLAFGYAELCRELNLECHMVYGQRDWNDYCWNIVRINGEYYHIDMGKCLSEGFENSVLLKDENIWESYRWDLSSYPGCKGSLKISDYLEKNSDKLENN